MTDDLLKRAEPFPGQLVTIDTGRHKGKVATFLGFDAVQSGQLQLYPRVGFPDGRELRVRSVTPVSRETEQAR